MMALFHDHRVVTRALQVSIPFSDALERIHENAAVAWDVSAPGLPHFSADVKTAVVGAWEDGTANHPDALGCVVLDFDGRERAVLVPDEGPLGVKWIEEQY